MKFILFLLFQLTLILAFASSELKINGEIFHSTRNAEDTDSGLVQMNATDHCSGWIERDFTWSVVPFNGSGGSGGPGLPPYYRNDDWSTPPIRLAFPFCFYGTSFDTVYINNNGTVSFGQPYPQFNTDSFPTLLFKGIAPFWSDVDTRDTSSGIVYYRLTTSSLIIQWDQVGIFQNTDSLYNTFQIILTNGINPLLSSGNNVSLSYKDMQWTTGNASGGTNGFGGIPANAGVNFGDGIRAFLIGRFNDSGAVYSGPYLRNNGIDFLDNQSYEFDLCNATNVAPFVKQTNICDTIEVCIGDTSIIDYEFFSPEILQTTSIAFNFFGLTGCGTLQNSPGNIGAAQGYIFGAAGNAGYHTIEVTATDNGSPQGSKSKTFVAHIKNVDATFYYSPLSVHVGDTVVFTANSSDNTFSIWDFGDGSPLDTGNVVTHIFNTAASFNVTLNAVNAECISNNSTTQQITVLIIGVDEIISDIQATLSPNPTNGFLLFNAKDNSEKYSIEISDIQGRIVFQKKNINANNTIDVNNLENGVYFYKISNSKGQLKGQLLKQ